MNEYLSYFKVGNYACSSLNGLVVRIRTRGPGFDSRVMPLFDRVATLDKLFTHIASPVSHLQETGVQKRSFRRLSDYDD